MEEILKGGCKRDIERIRIGEEKRRGGEQEERRGGEEEERSREGEGETGRGGKRGNQRDEIRVGDAEDEEFARLRERS